MKSIQRAHNFCSRFGLRVPILLAPMAGIPAPALSVAVANAGGLGACGALLMSPDNILDWSKTVRSRTSGPFQINNWIPEPAPPRRDPEHEARLKSFLSSWGPVPDGDYVLPNFAEQCDAMLKSGAPILSSVMGLYPPDFVARMKKQGVIWFANISSVTEAKLAEEAGADVIVAQGCEAGGHRGCFNAETAESQLIGLMSLLPAVVDAVKVPVVATGGIVDGPSVAAALVLGASAVQVGTGFLRCPEAGISPAWASALAQALPEDAVVSRVFSGRAGRSLNTAFVRAHMASGAPSPAPYPVQRGLTAGVRQKGADTHDMQLMQAWAGQSAGRAEALGARQVAENMWRNAKDVLSHSDQCTDVFL